MAVGGVAVDFGGEAVGGVGFLVEHDKHTGHTLYSQ